jgi:hypothetical protein
VRSFLSATNTSPLDIWDNRPMSIVSTITERGMWDKIKENKEPIFFPKANVPDVPWNKILDILCEDFTEPRRSELQSLIPIRLYGSFGYRSLRADRIDEVFEQVRELHKYFHLSNEYTDAPRLALHMYTSFTLDKESYNTKHADEDNVFYWQTQGTTRWEIWDEANENVVFDQVLSPGDFLYCPVRRYHMVTPLSARSALSLGFGAFREEVVNG